MKHLLNVSYIIAFYKIGKYNIGPVSKKLIIKQGVQDTAIKDKLW